MRGHATLAVAAVAALVTAVLVPPDTEYADYLDAKTLACLFGILAVVGAMRNAGMLDAAARVLASRLATRRAAVLSLVGATWVLSLFATNDMALVVMLPLSAAALLRAGWDDLIPFAFVMQNLVANLGGMVLPFGNPQNLYLYERYGIALGDFLAAMAAPFALSLALVALCCVAFVHGDGGGARRGGCGGGAASDAARGRAGAAGAGVAEAGVPGAPADGQGAQRAVPRGRAVAYVALFALVVGSVLRLVPWPAALAACVLALLALDRKALLRVDWGLLLTFACFFVFAGNMARIPAVEELLSEGMARAPLLVSAGASQVISNVPAAVLLSHVTDAWQPLLVGVNVGGAGTLVASLASLITFSHFCAVRRGFPRRAGLAACTPAKFVALFSAFNFAFLAVLLLASSLLAG